MDRDDKNLRLMVWTTTYIAALHAMLPRDAPPGLITSCFNENAQGVADEAVEHFNKFNKDLEAM